MRRGPGRGNDGFTLLEVLVALAILALAIVTSIQLFAGGLRLLKVAGEHQRATLIADQKAREMDVVKEGETSGDEGPYQWRRTVTVTEVPPDLKITSTSPYQLYAVNVSVRWADGRRSVQIATLRTGRVPVPGETGERPERERR